jgi:hypothetical protein
MHTSLIVLMIEAVHISKTSVNFYETTRRYIPECCHVYSRCRKNLKSHLGVRPCHRWGGLLPVTRRGNPGSRPCQSTWDLWWTNWQWDRVVYVFFGFHVCIIPPVLSTLIYDLSSSTWAWTIDPFVAAVQRHCLTPSTWMITSTLRRISRYRSHL